MKKFSFLLVGVLLLWSITFVLADENNDTEVNTLIATEATETAQPEATETAQPEATETAQPEATETAQPETTETAQPETTEAAQPEATEAAQPEATEATQPEVTEATQPEATEAAQPEATEATNDNSIKISDSAREKYTEEQIAAYEWAFNNGITTINDIEKARLNSPLTRAQLAKMMSQYLTNVLWETPVATEEKANYSDVNESLGDLADFIEVAYAYKIMWINADGTPLKKFNPKGQVTRAEYATVFSRVLFGDKFNKAEWKYYENHIKALKSVWILTNDNHSIKELRGWVMLMMYRSTNTDLSNPVIEDDNTSEDATQDSTEESTGWLAEIANPASVYCEENGGTLKIETAEDWNQSWICLFTDGSYCEEWSYFRNECKAGDIIYNTVSNEETTSES